MAVAELPPELPLVAPAAPPPLRHRGVAAPPGDLAVVVVNFCQWQNTARLVGQLLESRGARSRSASSVVVVDNRSPWHRVVRGLARRRGVTIVQNARNEGFARAVNRGVRASHGAWVLLLNPDVTVRPGFLDQVLAAAARADSRTGVIGFRLVNRDGTLQASAGAFPTLWSTTTGLTLPRAVRKCRPLTATTRTPVEWVTGGCLLVRRECLAELGGLSEQFFLYYEDVDLCRRAAAAGWGVWYDPHVTVTHHFPLHARTVPAALRLVTRHALLTYAHKHWRPWQATALGGLVWAEAWVRRLQAQRAGRPSEAAYHRRLGQLVGQLRRQESHAVERTIRAAARRLSAVAAAQDGRTA